MNRKPISKATKTLIGLYAGSLLLMVLMLFAMEASLSTFDWGNTWSFILGWVMTTVAIIHYGITSSLRLLLTVGLVGASMMALFFFL